MNLWTVKVKWTEFWRVLNWLRNSRNTNRTYVGEIWQVEVVKFVSKPWHKSFVIRILLIQRCHRFRTKMLKLLSKIQVRSFNFFLIFSIEFASTLFSMEVSSRCNTYVLIWVVRWGSLAEIIACSSLLLCHYFFALTCAGSPLCYVPQLMTSPSKSCKTCDRSRFIQSGSY